MSEQNGKKRFFILEKLEEMIDDMKKRVVMAKTKKENSTNLGMETAAEKAVKKESASEKGTTKSVGIKKEFLKTKNACRVTFRLPKIAAPDAKSVCVVGDFNNWDIHANPMKKLEDEDYAVTLDLEPGREYQFRYLIDESKWENDWNADKYVKSPYGDSDNSVVFAGYYRLGDIDV